jgi:hypothetical protein
VVERKTVLAVDRVDAYTGRWKGGARMDCPALTTRMSLREPVMIPQDELSAPASLRPLQFLLQLLAYCLQ